MTTERAPFTFAVRACYEYTDAAGVVHCAKCLKFMERARTEWVAAIGFDVDALACLQRVAFAGAGSAARSRSLETD